MRLVDIDSGCCSVPLCMRNAPPGDSLFCKRHWMQLPTSSRRKFRRNPTEVRWQGLVIRILTTQLRTANDRIRWYEEMESQFQGAEMLSRMGMNLDCINRMALEIQRLKELVNESLDTPIN